MENGEPEQERKQGALVRGDGGLNQDGRKQVTLRNGWDWGTEPTEPGDWMWNVRKRRRKRTFRLLVKLNLILQPREVK